MIPGMGMLDQLISKWRLTRNETFEGLIMSMELSGRKSSIPFVSTAPWEDSATLPATSCQFEIYTRKVYR